jgi:hypothetical protein
MSKSLETAKAELAAARDALAALLSNQRGLADKLDRLKAQVVGLEAEIGEVVADAVLAGGSDDYIREQGKRLQLDRGQAEAAEGGLKALTPRVEAAQRRVHEAQAACLVMEAQALEQAAAVRQAKTDELLAALEAWEECPYEPRRISAPVTAAPGKPQAAVVVPRPKTETSRLNALYLRKVAAAWMAGKPYTHNPFAAESVPCPLPDYLGPTLGAKSL